MMPPKPEDELGSEAVFQKLGKSIVAGCDLIKGDKLSLENLSGKIFGEQYIPVRESNIVLGKTLTKDTKKGDLIFYENLV